MAAPQRHVAVVKPVSQQPLQIATSSHLVEVHAMMQRQQSVKFPNSQQLKDQLMYAPMYNIYIPHLNQYLTIPIATNAQGLAMGSILNQAHGHNPVNAIQSNTTTTPNQIQTLVPNQMPPSVQNQMSSAVYNHITRQAFQPFVTEHKGKETEAYYKSLHRERGKKVNEVKPIPVPQKNNARKNVFDSGIKQLLQSQMNQSKSTYESTSKLSNQFNRQIDREIGNSFLDTGATLYPSAKSERVCRDRGPFPSEKSKKLTQSPMVSNQTMSLIGKERLQELQDAIRTTDCCEIDTGSTMPFKCPDGVWRLVNFKCLRGVWVIQIPGSSTPTVFLPLDAKKMASREKVEKFDVMKNFKTSQIHSRNLKRKPSHGHEEPIEAKRLCASAPVPGFERHELPRYDEKRTTINRTRSNPNIHDGLSKNARHFMNDEGKKINISMIKQTANSIPSCDLIRSLLMNGRTNKSSAQVKPTTPCKSNAVKNNRCQFTRSKFSYFVANESTAKVSLAY